MLLSRGQEGVEYRRGAEPSVFTGVDAPVALEIFVVEDESVAFVCVVGVVAASCVTVLLRYRRRYASSIA